MTPLWEAVQDIIPEARDETYYREKLIRYVQSRFGQHAADEMVRMMQELSPEEFADYAASEFVDDGVDDLVGSMVTSGGGSEVGAERVPGRGPTATRSRDKGTGPSEPIPSRPRASDVRSPLHSPPSSAVAPGEKPQHAVGSAGQNRPKQPDYLRPGITSGPKTSAGVMPQTHDPERDPASGIVAAQREVDRMYKSGDKGGAAKLARQLRVPPPEERVHRDSQGRPVRDAAGNPRIVVWSPDRVFKWLKDDSRHLDVSPESPRATSMAGVGPREPVERPDRLDMIKRGLVKRNVAPSPEVERKGPERPPNFDGEVWQPHGREREDTTMRPDPMTGRFVFGKRQVDPAKTGQKLIGYKGKWYTPSEYVAMRAQAAGVRPPPGEPRAWRASQHPPRRGVHAGATPAEPPRRPPPRPEVPEPEDEFSDVKTDPDIGSDDDRE